VKNNLIGISGKIGSSKDTIGKILQYLATPSGSNEFTLEDYLTDKSSYLYAGNNYQIKKYAELPKNIVCLLIGCTREQLEDQEFKEKELGEEWWVWKSRPRGTIYLYIGQNMDLNYWDLIKLTPRLLLQLLGTECGRDIIHPNIWVNALFADYTPFIPGDINKSMKEPFARADMKYRQEAANWIITDVRFPNEAQAIKDRGGIVIRVNRYDENGMPYKTLNNHPSETALDEYEFDHVIDNDGSIEELVEKVKQLKLV